MRDAHYNRSGWGVNLNEYMHDVMCCLTLLQWEGLTVNHHTWTNDGPDDGAAVATHSASPRTYLVRILKVDDGVTINLKAIRFGREDHNILSQFIIENGERKRTINKMLDVILKEE